MTIEIQSNSRICGETLTFRLGGVWHAGRGSAPCPVCQPEGRRDQQALSISESGGKLLLYCFKNGCRFKDVATAADVPPSNTCVDHTARTEAEEKRKAYEFNKLQQARGIWEAARPIKGTKAEAYLRDRGITCTLPPSLRFAPDLFHSPTTSWCMAMIANVTTGAIHRTFFDKKGVRVSKNPKLMLGPCSGGAVVLSEAAKQLVVCEGIETGLSLLSGLLNGPAAVWAALSTSGMKALKLPPYSGKITIATDGDPAGIEAGQSLASRASSLGWQVSLLPAPEGCDWNDVLRGKKGGQA